MSPNKLSIKSSKMETTALRTRTSGKGPFPCLRKTIPPTFCKISNSYMVWGHPNKMIVTRSHLKRGQPPQKEPNEKNHMVSCEKGSQNEIAPWSQSMHCSCIRSLCPCCPPSCPLSHSPVCQLWLSHVL